MFKRLLDLIKNPSHEDVPERTQTVVLPDGSTIEGPVHDEPVRGEISVSRETESLKDVLAKTANEGLIVGRTVDNNIALSVPGYALITMFMLAFRHGPTICGMVNSMGYHVDRILGDKKPSNIIEQSARMIVNIFQEQKHGIMAPFPFVRAEGYEEDDLEARYNAIMEPAKFIELVSSINELNQDRPDFGSEALNSFVTEIVDWVNYGMAECITPVDMMSSLGASIEGKA